MEYSLLLYDSLSWKKELVNVERIVKVYLPSYTVSCNSKVKELNNEVIKLNYHVIAFEEKSNVTTE